MYLPHLLAAFLLAVPSVQCQLYVPADTLSSQGMNFAAKSFTRYLNLLYGPGTLSPTVLPLNATLDVSTLTAGDFSVSPVFIFHPSVASLQGQVPERCVASGVVEGSFSVCRVGRVVILGAHDVPGVLYASTTLLERLGVRFTLHGVTLPPKGVLPTLEAAFPEFLALSASPIFNLRGLQPFHDFYEGPDTWSADGWAAVAESIAQMKGNVLAIHTYPYSPTLDTGTNEPSVWLGPASLVNGDGTVAEAYPTSWASTSRSEWGDVGTNSGDFYGGAAAMFDYQCSGHPIQAGNASRCPWPTSPGASVDIFNEVGALWAGLFPFAQALGVKSFIGTETPMTLPTYGTTILPLSVFYSPQRDDHFTTTTQCNECDGFGYTLVGVVGGLYASPTAAPGLIAMSTYYNPILTDNILLPQGTPPPSGYTLVRVEGYALPSASAYPPGGALPVLQYLKPTPKADHWALAGAQMAANASGLGYSVDTSVGAGGIMGYALPLSAVPTPPTAFDYYVGAFTRLQRLLGASLDTYWIWTPEFFEWDQVSIDDPRIKAVVADLAAAQAARDSINGTFKLATCGWVVGPKGARWYMDVVLPPNWTISSIDMQVGNSPVDVAYKNITHHPKVVIPWLEDDPGLTSLELWVNRTLQHNQDAQAYGASGLLNIHWRTRSISPQAQASHAYAWNQSLTSVDFWADWALHNFGPSAAPGAAAVFEALDSYGTPRPVNWDDGPGGWSPGGCGDLTPGNPKYAFPDTFGGLRGGVVGDMGAGLADASTLERFDYWLTTLRYTRAIARTTCAWEAYNGAIAAIQKLPPAQQPGAATTTGYAAWAALVGNASVLMWDLMSSASSPGEWGTIVNTQTHTLLPKVVGPAQEGVLARLAGVPSLPPSLAPPTAFDAGRVPLLRVPVVRTSVGAGEGLLLRAHIIAGEDYPPTTLTLFTAPLSGGSSTTFTPTPLLPAPSDGPQRWVFQATIPPATITAGGGVQWYITALLKGNTTEFTGEQALLPSPGCTFSPGVIAINFPPTAPALPQTVVVV